ncbi:hypothetical protein [Kiloniella antarctica]|uniref:Uncharacterized protein n=1 Tax=Kiloniella antarctica TaxID=1550907 RepID=A0ABW5BQV5_9PROT
MAKRLLSHDPFTGVSQYFHSHDDGNGFDIETIQDVESVLTENKAIRNEDTGRYGDGMHKVASIPMVKIHELMKTGVIGINGEVADPARLRKFLNDPDNRYFRTKEGTV